MSINTNAIDFLSGYNESVADHALRLRELILSALPGITEQVDIPAKMVAYCYGQKYAELVCTIIPSQKGLKLGFNRGVSLPDPSGLLEGTGKISRYVVIKSAAQVEAPELQALLLEAFAAYKERVRA
jgi:hypothetical protein